MEKAVRNAQDEMPLSSAWQSVRESLNGILTNEKKILHQLRNDSSYIVFLFYINCGMTIHNHFVCPRGIFIKNSLGIIPKERQRSDEESHIKLTSIAKECWWKSSALCSRCDASLIGMTLCIWVFKRHRWNDNGNNHYRLKHQNYFKRYLVLYFKH
jgi:hypothetical protein